LSVFSEGKAESGAEAAPSEVAAGLQLLQVCVLSFDLIRRLQVLAVACSRLK